jgi:hypothetical protein
MPYSTVIDVTTCLVDVGDDTGSLHFEPGRVLSNLPIDWSDTKYILLVRIYDGEKSVEYEVEKFLSKTYRSSNGKIRFGTQHFDISSLQITVGWKILFKDLSHITDSRLD